MSPFSCAADKRRRVDCILQANVGRSARLSRKNPEGIEGSQGLSSANPADTLTVSRVVPGRRERVFRAWTKPGEVKKWWTVGEGWIASSVKIDLRVGGKFSLANEADTGASTVITGEYLVVEPPSKLVYTWRFPGAPPEPGTIAVEFHDLGPQTDVVVTHTKVSKEMVLGAIQGWEAALASLFMFMVRSRPAK